MNESPRGPAQEQEKCDCASKSTAAACVQGMFAIVFVVAWIGGMVIAKGFWLKALAFCSVIGGWYFFIERIFEVTGFIR